MYGLCIFFTLLSYESVKCESELLYFYCGDKHVSARGHFDFYRWTDTASPVLCRPVPPSINLVNRIR